MVILIQKPHFLCPKRTKNVHFYAENVIVKYGRNLRFFKTKVSDSFVAEAIFLYFLSLETRQILRKIL